MPVTFRRLIFAMLALLVIGGATILVYNLFFSQSNPTTRITTSAESTADAFITELRTKNVDAAYARFSDRLKANYSDTYWKTGFFPRFADYRGDVKLTTNEQLRPATPSEPFPYDDTSEPRRLAYDFQFEGLTYRLQMVIVKKNSQWLINELEGAYLPQT